jgi:hypothetical protein
MRAVSAGRRVYRTSILGGFLVWIIVAFQPVVADDKPAQPPPKANEKKTLDKMMSARIYEFKAAGMPWEDALDWVRDISGKPLSLNDNKPTGSFSFNGPKGIRYSVRDIVDILNDALLVQKMYLIDRGATFTVIAADRWSVPESPDRAVLAHNTRMQDEYLRFLRDLFRRHGLTMGAVPKVAEPDTTTAPRLPNKMPLYTRFVFHIEAEGTDAAVIKMLEELRNTPLLHTVRKLELTNLRPARDDSNLEVVLEVELLQVSGAEKRYTLLPYSLGLGMALGPAQAAMFTSPLAAHSPVVLAQPERVDADKPVRKPSSDHLEALRANKLVCIMRTGPYRRYEGLLYDPRQPLPSEAQRAARLDQRDDRRYVFLRPTKVVEFWILDDYVNEILSLRVVDMTPDEILFKVVRASPAAKRITEKKAFPQNMKLTTDRPLLSDDPEQVYRMHVGDSLTEALASRFTPPETEPKK